MPAARQRVSVNIAHHDCIARRRRDLRDPAAHGARAQHRDRFDRARRRRVVNVSVRVCAQRVSRKNVAEPQMVDLVQATVWLGPAWFD